MIGENAAYMIISIFLQAQGYNPVQLGQCYFAMLILPALQREQSDLLLGIIRINGDNPVVSLFLPQIITKSIATASGKKRGKMMDRPAFGQLV